MTVGSATNSMVSGSPRGHASESRALMTVPLRLGISPYWNPKDLAHRCDKLCTLVGVLCAGVRQEAAPGTVACADGRSATALAERIIGCSSVVLKKGLAPVSGA